jgi:hypothetical protein
MSGLQRLVESECVNRFGQQWVGKQRTKKRVFPDKTERYPYLMIQTDINRIALVSELGVDLAHPSLVFIRLDLAHRTSDMS